MYNINYYTVFGLKYPSSQEEIKKAYHNLIKKYHPDVGGDTEKMQILNQAYDVLSDSAKKAKYDKWLLEIIKKDTDSEPKKSNSYSQPHQQEQQTKLIMHLLTIEGYIREKYIDVRNLKFDYKKYADEYNQLYFYETHKGNMIVTNITYKASWFDLKKKRSPKSNPESDPKKVKKKVRKKAFTLQHPNISTILGIIILIALPICIFFSPTIIKHIDGVFSYDYSPSHPTQEYVANNAAQNDSNPHTATTEPSLPPQEPLPDNGAVFLSSSQQCVAPLTIDTTKTSDNYYIYLKYYGNDRSRDMSFFVRANNSLNIDVPLGTYEMFYCSGSDWYGTENKFGYNTSYCKADERFEFTSDNEYVYGHTVTLYPVSNGNLETKEIEESSFPG